MSQVKKTISIVIGIIIVLLLSSLLFSLYTIRNIQSNLDIQVNTRTVIVTLKDNLTALINAETGERGYLITGDTNSLQPYFLAQKAIPPTVNSLEKLLSRSPAQRQALDSMLFFINQNKARAENMIALKRQGKASELNSLLVANEGKYWMDKIRMANQLMQQREEELFTERKLATNRSIALAGTVLIIEGIFSLLAVFFLATIIMKELDRRNRNEKRMKVYNLELERKNREIEQFAYIASHDLQEPLRSIANFSKLLSQKVDRHPDKETKEYAELINGAAGRMSALIHDLLEYSRIGQESEKSLIDCNELMREIMADMSAAIQESQATIRVDKLPVVRGFVQLKSLFQNLLSNALKFVAPGVKPLVQVTVMNREKDYLFSVRDNGIGIEKIYQERVFVIFQRLHGRTSYPGTGIGLSQCRKIVELHGGEIWIESEPGKGTTFKFTIPKI